MYLPVIKCILHSVILWGPVLNFLNIKVPWAHFVNLCFSHQHVQSVYYDWLVQERCNSIANALELHFSCTNLLIWFRILNGNSDELYMETYHLNVASIYFNPPEMFIWPFFANIFKIYGNSCIQQEYILGWMAKCISPMIGKNKNTSLAQ